MVIEALLLEFCYFVAFVSLFCLFNFGAAMEFLRLRFVRFPSGFYLFYLFYLFCLCFRFFLRLESLRSCSVFTNNFLSSWMWIVSSRISILERFSCLINGLGLYLIRMEVAARWGFWVCRFWLFVNLKNSF